LPSRNKKTNCSNIKELLADQLQDEVTKLNFYDYDNKTINNLDFIKQMKSKEKIKSGHEKETTNQEKFDEKLENINFEQKLEKKRKLLAERLKELKTELEKCQKKLEQKNEEIREIIFDIEVLTNYENDTNLSEKLRRSLNQLVDVKVKDQSEQDKFLKIRMSYMVDLDNYLEDFA
jgi:hypothetical protein